MWVLLPILLIVVLLATVGSLFAGLFWLIGGTWPWLLIGLGAWLFWHEDGQHRRTQRRPAWVAAPAPLRGREKLVQRQNGPRASHKADLPIDLQVKVEQIRRKVDVLLGYADRFPPFSQDLYLVRQTASEYLPRTVNAFLALPADAVDRPLASGTGGTAREELRSQLNLLDAKLDEIAQDLQRQDADRLLANRRFLESRFGEHEDTAPKEPLSA